MSLTGYLKRFRLQLSYLREHFLGIEFAKRRGLYPAPQRRGPGEVRALAGKFHAGLPAVFSGQASSWAAMAWSPRFFAKNYGDATCRLMTDYGLADFGRRNEYREIPMRDFVAGMKRGKSYLRFSALVAERAELMSSLDTAWLRRFRRWDSLSEAFHLFIGGRGTFTRLHAEMEISLFIQCSGQKKWRLFAPNDYTQLYPSFRGRTHFVTEFDAWPGGEFPLLHGATCYEVILNAGDVLYLPPFWWHYAENLTDSVGVSYRFNAPTLALLTAPFLTAMRLMSYRPSVFYTLYHALVTRRNPLFEVKRGA